MRYEVGDIYVNLIIRNFCNLKVVGRFTDNYYMLY